MNKHTLVAAALTAFVFGASPVLAGNEHKHDATPVQGKSQAKPHTHKAQTHKGSPKADGRHDNGRHLGWYKQQWKRGDRLVWTDIEPRYYVTDYRSYRLSAPPEGYRWVRPMDDRYLLVQVATGLITKALGY